MVSTIRGNKGKRVTGKKAKGKPRDERVDGTYFLITLSPLPFSPLPLFPSSPLSPFPFCPLPSLARQLPV